MLPHEATHAGPKEGRLELLRATRTQLEPIFLLYDAEPPLERPDGEPDDGRRGGRRAHARSGASPERELELDAPLLIADGHHRYETAVAFRDEEPAATHTLRRARLVALARARDLPDPPHRAGGRRRPRSAS